MTEMTYNAGGLNLGRRCGGQGGGVGTHQRSHDCAGKQGSASECAFSWWFLPEVVRSRSLGRRAFRTAGEFNGRFAEPAIRQVGSFRSGRLALRVVRGLARRFSRCPLGQRSKSVWALFVWV